MIEEMTRRVYRSTAAGRSFLTKPAAIHAEAVALIKRKHPTEKEYFGEYGMADPGFHWASLPRHHVLLRRVERLVKAARKL